MPRPYIRNLTRFPDPAVVTLGTRLIPNVPAERLFVGDPSARAACLEGLDLARRFGCAREQVVGPVTMVFFPIFTETDAIEAVVGMAGRLEDLPRLLHELERGLPRLGEILHQTPNIVLTARPNGQIDYLSRQWYEVFETRQNLTPEDALTQAMSASDHRKFSVGWMTAIARGVEFTLPAVLRTKDGIRAYELRARAVMRPHGGIMKWIATLTDVDDAVKATEDLLRLKRRHEILAEAGAIASAAQTLGDIAAGLAGMPAQPGSAYWFAELRNTRAGDVVRRNLGQAERDAIDRALGQNAETAIVPSQDTGAFVAAALRGAQGNLGFLGFARDRSGEPTSEEVALVKDVANRIATAIERLVAHTRDQELARMLQRSMLPLALPQSPWIRLDVVYDPAEREALVGGDWYDAFELPDGTIAVAIGDVAGHGFDAALVMNRVRQLMRAAAVENPEPSAVLALANRVLVAEHQPMVTALFGILDPLTLAFRCASAGHVQPLVVDERGDVRNVSCEGVPMGILPELGCSTVGTELPQGGALVLYTDGVIEDRRDILEGEEALRRALERWALEGFAHRAAAVQASLRTGRHQDDAAMFVLRFPHVDEIDVRLPATPFNAQRMRRATRRFLAALPFVGERAFDLTLAIGEALNNAVTHAYGTGEGQVSLRLKRDSERLFAEIRDEGVWRAPPAFDRMHGLGIIEKLADRFEISTDRGGTCVEIEMAFTPALRGLATATVHGTA
ncbi:MAG: SpoIIE family protein phosphatase [Candidatus Eremiobacteraeota bacterium]|nr:SpoIIE family protein phosphatase [Candidatus Eremiobacteraeota bacterium]